MCELDKGDLERLLFEILPRFPNIHTLDLECNNIENLLGIEDRIKQHKPIPLLQLSSSSPSPSPSPSSSSSSSSSSSQTVIPDNKLRKLTLTVNPAASNVSTNPCEKVTHDPKEEAALITILDAFDGIYHIGGVSHLGHYPSDYASDVEHLLRINHSGRKFIKEGEKQVPGSRKPNIKLVSWLKIFEKAHSKSAEIQDNYIWDDEESINRKKCATGLFHLVRHFCEPLFAENHRRRSCDNQETSAAASSVATTANRIGIRINDALNRKRKLSQVYELN